MSSWLQPLIDFYAASQRGPIPEFREADEHPASLKIAERTAEQACLLALAWVGEPTTYRLGGGASPLAHPSPFGKDGTCDCSGFTGHSTGHSRIQRIGGKRTSFYTDNIVRDAFGFTGSQWFMTGKVTPNGPHRMYLPVTRNMEVKPGDLLVKPGAYSTVLRRRVKIGHVWIVVGIDSNFRRGVPGWRRRLDVVSCMPNRGRAASVRRGIPSASVEERSYFVRPRWYTS